MKGFLKFTITEASVKTITHVHKYNPESKSKHFDSIHSYNFIFSIFFKLPLRSESSHTNES